MSIAAQTWVSKLPLRPSSLKYVLLAFADCASETGVCFPSVQHVVEWTSQDRKTVIDNIAELKRLGFLQDTGKKTGRTGQIPVYRLKSPPGALPEESQKRNGSEIGTVEESQKRNSTENGTVPFSDGKGPVFPSKQSQKRDTDPSGIRQEPEEGASQATLPPPADAPITKKGKAKRSVAKKPSTTWPTDFALTDARRAYVLMNLPDADPPAVFESYRLLCASKDMAFSDWEAAFMRHVRDLRPDSNHFSAGQYTRRGGAGAAPASPDQREWDQLKAEARAARFRPPTASEPLPAYRTALRQHEHSIATKRMRELTSGAAAR